MNGMEGSLMREGSPVKEIITLNADSVVSEHDLPPLPVDMYDLSSNIASVLAGLDKMEAEEGWEEGVFSQFERKYCTGRCY